VQTPMTLLDFYWYVPLSKQIKFHYKTKSLPWRSDCGCFGYFRWRDA